MNASPLDALLEGAVAKGALPGIVAAVGDRDGTRYAAAFGRRSVESDDPATADTLFWIASMTKAMVSVAALAMIERGELELEQPVADILPRFAELGVLEGFDGDTPRLRPAATPATIRQLFTHTSGLGYWFSNPDILRYHEVTGVPTPFDGKLAMLDVPLVFDPGERWEYGTSIDWLGQVVEAVSGQDLDSHLRAAIWEPLGMVDTTFDPSDAQRARLMAVHTATAGAPLRVSSVALPEEQEFWSGGGGAFSTATDYLRFLRAILRGGELDGERILSPESVDLALSDQLHGAPMPTTPSISAVPELTHDVPVLPFRQAYGLGFNVFLEDVPGMRRAGTGNWAGLADTFFWVDRTSGIAAVFLTQVLPFFDLGVIETLVGFEGTFYATLAA